MRRLAPAVIAAVVAGSVAIVPNAASADADRGLGRNLDAVIGLSPDDTCLTVRIDGETVYDHRGTDLQVPASTEKLLTAGAALDVLGADHTFQTRLVTASAAVGGVIEGDVVLVGGGDPTVVTSIYRALRHLPGDRPLTLLDDLVDVLEAQGITRISGRVLGDESRYDSLRSVPTWPERYVRQNQSGPLSALTVDNGYLISAGPDGAIERKRSADPPTDAARALTALLRARGIEVTGEPASGRAPAGATELATLTSAPLDALASDLLARSDNQAAELLAKELGVVAGDGGSTAAGARVVASWAADHQAAAPGSAVVDGSGLDRANAHTCRDLVTVLDASGGPDGLLASGLPVAGRTGTLANRFTTTDAVGRLRAKTGTLNGVTALAGFVELPDGDSATFAYVVNTDAVGAPVLRAQDFLAQILATYLPPCPDGAPPPVVGPAAAQAAQVGALSAGPAVAALPGLVGSLRAVQSRASDLLDRCSAEGEALVDLGAG